MVVSTLSVSVKVSCGVVSVVFALFTGTLMVEVGIVASTVISRVIDDAVSLLSVQLMFQLCEPSVSTLLVMVEAVLLATVPLVPTNAAINNRRTGHGNIYCAKRNIVEVRSSIRSERIVRWCARGDAGEGCLYRYNQK